MASASVHAADARPEAHHLGGRCLSLAGSGGAPPGVNACCIKRAVARRSPSPPRPSPPSPSHSFHQRLASRHSFLATCFASTCWTIHSFSARLLFTHSAPTTHPVVDQHPITSTLTMKFTATSVAASQLFALALGAPLLQNPAKAARSLEERSAYKVFGGDGTVAQGWPQESEWKSFDDMW